MCGVAEDVPVTPGLQLPTEDLRLGSTGISEGTWTMASLIPSTSATDRLRSGYPQVDDLVLFRLSYGGMLFYLPTMKLADPLDPTITRVWMVSAADGT